MNVYQLKLLNYNLCVIINILSNYFIIHMMSQINNHDENFNQDELFQYFDLGCFYCSSYLKNFIILHNEIYPSKAIEYCEFEPLFGLELEKLFTKKFQHLSIIKDSSIWFKSILYSGASIETGDVKKFLKNLHKNHPLVDVYCVTEKYRSLTYYTEAVIKHNYPVHSDTVFDFCKKHLSKNIRDANVKRVLQLFDKFPLEERFITYLDQIYTSTDNSFIKNSIEQIIDHCSIELQKLSVVSERAKKDTFSSHISTIYRTQMLIERQNLIKTHQISTMKTFTLFNSMINAVNDYVKIEHANKLDCLSFIHNQSSTDSSSNNCCDMRYESENLEVIQSIDAFFRLLTNNTSTLITEFLLLSKHSSLPNMLPVINTLVLKQRLDEQLHKQEHTTTRTHRKL